MKTRWWELATGVAGLLFAVEFAAGAHLVRFVIAIAFFLWIASRVLPRYAVLWLFARRALRRWRLGPQAVLDTIRLGVRMDRLFTPVLAAKRLRHGRAQCGWAYALFVPIVREGAAAHGALRQLSFYDTSDTLALAQPLESLRDLGSHLDRIDASLIRSSGGTVEDKLRMTPKPNVSENRGPAWSAAEAVQSTLEGTLGRRSGADGEWFRLVIAKRRDLLAALREGHSAMRRMKQKAVWMLERQRETRAGAEVEMIDVTAARSELREASQLVTALADGVGEVHLGPPARR
jgi:hypothetical protein